MSLDTLARIIAIAALIGAVIYGCIENKHKDGGHE